MRTAAALGRLAGDSTARGDAICSRGSRRAAHRARRRARRRRRRAPSCGSAGSPTIPHSILQIDHDDWDAFLVRYLRIGEDGVHRVAYGEVTPADRAPLDDYIARLAGLPISAYNRAEQLAYWINLYNALVVRLVVDHYPIASIRDIGSRRLRPGAAGPGARSWSRSRAAPISLSDIEHRILRPIWRDPRVHYALACGAVSCPNLQPEPFYADQLERQLSEAAMAYVNDPRCIRIEGDQLGLSSLYRWYREDFGGTDRDVINHLMAYAEPKPRDEAAAVRPDHRRRLRLAAERRRPLTRAARRDARRLPSAGWQRVSITASITAPWPRPLLSAGAAPVAFGTPARADHRLRPARRGADLRPLDRALSQGLPRRADRRRPSRHPVARGRAATACISDDLEQRTARATRACCR